MRQNVDKHAGSGSTLIKKEAMMTRYSLDCRDYPSDTKCSLALSADSKEELVEAVMEHARKVHKYEDTPEVREKIKSGIKET